MSIGTIGLELYDADKPVTVANFLNYVSSGRYAGTFAHRLVPGFVLQGGGYVISDGAPTHIETFPAIQNEFASGTAYSNLSGTIAMAKLGGNPDSATSEWFINLGDNAANLDAQNGGFTVFGRVVYGGDVLATLNTTFRDADSASNNIVNAGGSFTDLPITTDLDNGSVPLDSLLYTNVVVVPEPPVYALIGLGILLLAPFAGRPRNSVSRS